MTNSTTGHFIHLLVAAAFTGFTATAAVSCEVTPRSWPNLIVSITDPSAHQFWLNAPDAPDAQIVVTYTDQDRDRSSKGVSKRFRIASGHPINIEQVKDRKNDASFIRYQSGRGKFNGSFTLDSEDLVRASHVFVSSADGQNLLIATKYKRPRKINDALDDVVCAYNQVPALMEESS